MTRPHGKGFLGLLARLYPARFRDEYGDDLRSLLDADHEHHRRRGSLVGFWWRTVTGVLVSAPREHLADLGLDLRWSLRGLRRRPVFVLVAAVSMGVGIGAATTVVATLDSLFLQPVPGIGAPDELVNVKPWDPGSEQFGLASYPDLEDLRSGTRTLEGLGAFAGVVTSLRTGSAEPRPVLTQATSSNYLEILGARPSRGRFFLPEEERAASTVAFVSHWLWRNELGEPSELGTVTVNGRRLDVVGVGPPEFRGNFKGFPVDLFLPLGLAELVGLGPLDERSEQSFELVGRLAHGAELGTAAAEVERLGVELAKSHPDTFGERSLEVEPMTGIDADLRGGLLVFLLILLAVTCLILLIAALNVAGMMASRAVERADETAVRLALGAPRHRLTRQLVVEALLLGLLAATLGLGLALWGSRLVGGALATVDSRIAVDVNPDPTALLASVGLAVAVALLASLASGSVARRAPLVPSRRGVAGGGRWRPVLVVGQVLLSFVVLTCAVFFLRALGEAARTDLGFEPGPVAVTSLDPRLAQMETAEAQRLFERLLAEVESIPGVVHAGLLTRVPLSLGARFFANTVEVGVPGHRPPGDAEAFAIEHATVSHGTLETLGIDLVAGRAFRPNDDQDAAPVVIVNEVFARRFWEGYGAVDRSLRVDGREHRVVGVAREARYRTLDEDPTPFLYLPFLQRRPARTQLVARAEGSAAELLPRLRAAQLELAPDLPVQQLEPLESRISAALLPQRVGAAAAGSLGLLGLALSVFGLTGVLLHWVAGRRREIGVRVSLGAGPRSVLKLVVVQGGLLTLAGVVLGAPLAAVLGHGLEGFLYGVSPLDPWTHLAVAAVLMVAGLLACAGPAARALRVDPLEALRSQ